MRSPRLLPVPVACVAGRLWVLAVIVGLGGISPARLRADEPKAKAPAPGAGGTLLHRVLDLVQGAKSIEVELERALTIGENEMKTTATLALQRPNRFAFENKQTGLAMSIVSDGQKLFVSIPALKRYTESEAPAKLDAEALAKDPVVAGTLQDMVLALIWMADPYQKLTEGATEITLAEPETLDGAKLNRLSAKTEAFDWQMWVAAEGLPTIHHVAFDFSRSMARVPNAPKGQKFQMVEHCKNWRINAEVKATAFRFEPPEGSKKVANLLDRPAQAAPPSLVGKPAPDIALKRLDDGEFRLSSFRNSKVVMVDFWATWCGPCVKELPILAEVADAYKDKGVAFFAVNLREKPEEIREFLEEKKLKVAVALDSEGATAETFGVQGIPTLVLIDKSGKIQAVHVGYSPEIKSTLSRELDDLLAGKDLAAESAKKVEASQEPSKTKDAKP